MREDVLQNDAENMKHKKNAADSEDITIEVVDLTGDEWDAPECDNGSSSDLLFERFDRYIPVLRIAIPILAVVFAVLVLIIATAPKGNAKKQKTAESFVSSMPRQEEAADTKTEKTSETAKEQAGAGERKPVDTKEDSTKNEEASAMLKKEQERYQALHDTVFGESNGNSSLGCVTAVTGFTEREKREIGFQESDFLKDAGAFLSKQQIQTKRIIVEDRIAGSSSAAVAFQGRLEGKDDYILDMVFYPDLPGEYIFLLRNIKGNERQNGTNAEAGAADQNKAGNDTQSQNIQNNAAVQGGSQAVTAPQSTQEDSQMQDSYNAADLSVKQIPETLLNYIDNRYEFQYSLYDWLYNHGKKNVESATVTDYSIDGDSRKATIDLVLSDGSSVAAVYDKTANSYSFER